MIEGLPAYVSPVFLITSFVTVLLFAFAIRSSGSDTFAAKLLVFLLPFWMIFQGVMALGGFYSQGVSVPPRVVLFAVLPAVLLIVVYFIAFRKSFIEGLPLKPLTLIHTIRIPVEICLLWLYQSAQVPIEMTFEGRNFDILSGVTAPIAYFFGFRNGHVNKRLIAAWNVLALLLLINIVSTAVLSFEGPIQQFGLAQPNRAVNYFPFIWLPAVVVPIVLFCHLASLWKILMGTSAPAD